MKEKCVVILSGGLDSTVLLYTIIAEGLDPEAITFSYGQRHRREIDYARKTCEDLRVPHNVLYLDSLAPIFIGSSLTDEIDVPEGHYQDESMKSTVVPNRNSIMINLAMAYAIGRKIKYVAYGAHAGDHAIYPDCRPIFVERIQKLAEVVDYNPLYIKVPFLIYKKEDIVRIGQGLKVPFANTYSCYKGGEIHCGVCGTCTERKEAFKNAGVEDPTEYLA
jgi:7-cyano-7-deazaguanine synthase